MGLVDLGMGLVHGPRYGLAMDLAYISSHWLGGNSPSSSSSAHLDKEIYYASSYIGQSSLILLFTRNVDPPQDVFLKKEVGWRTCFFWQLNFAWMQECIIGCFNCWIYTMRLQSTIHGWYPRTKSIWGTSAFGSCCGLQRQWIAI